MRWTDLRKTLKAGISNLNDIFGFFNPKELLENDHRDKWGTAFKSMYEDAIGFSDVMVEIGRFKRLVGIGWNE